MRLFFSLFVFVAALMLPVFSAQADQSTAAGLPEQPADMAEAPLWPIGVRLSDEMVGERTARRANRPADVLIHLPPGPEPFRALMIVPNNTDSKNFLEYGPLRQVADRHRMAIVYLRHFHTGIEYHHRRPVETPPEAPDNILKLLKLLADHTGRPEIEHLPWVTMGKSSRGEFPFRMGWIYPERTIAGITYHGETPTWPIPAYAAPQEHSILYLAVNGQEEWSGTWYRHVRPSMLNYRATNNWLPHQLVAPGVGHGDYVDAHGRPGWGQPVPEGTTSVRRVWDYMVMFVDRALTLRLPAAGSPENQEQSGQAGSRSSPSAETSESEAKASAKPGMTKLRQIDPNTGYLVHPRAVEQVIGLRWKAFRQQDGRYQIIPWPDEEHPVVDSQQGSIEPHRLILRATDVPEAERRNYFWIPDRQMALVWVDLHNVKNQNIIIRRE